MDRNSNFEEVERWRKDAISHSNKVLHELNSMVEVLSSGFNRVSEEIQSSDYVSLPDNQVLCVKVEKFQDFLTKINKEINDKKIEDGADFDAVHMAKFFAESMEMLSGTKNVLESTLDHFRINNFLDALSREDDAVTERSSERTTAQEWWNAIYRAMCNSYNRKTKYDVDRSFEIAISDTSFRYLMFAADELRRGNIPAGILRVQSSNAPNIRGDLRQCIRMANAYARSAKNSEIDDASPFSSISEAYGVTVPTARRWFRESEKYLSPYFSERDKAEDVLRDFRYGAENYRRAKGLRKLEH